MSKINFIYRKNNFEMVLQDKNISIDIFKEYSKNINGKMKYLLFLFKGKNIFLMNSQQIINMLKSNERIIILVYNLNINYKADNVDGNFVCPDCKNLTFLNLNENNINNCKNKYINKCSFEYASITEFMKNQFIDEKEIKCSLCNNNKFFIWREFLYLFLP